MRKLLLFSILAFISAKSYAVLIAEFTDHKTASFYQYTNIDTYIAFTSYLPGGPGLPGEDPIPGSFYGVCGFPQPVNESSVGQTFEIVKDGQEFSRIAEKLTNGENDYICIDHWGDVWWSYGFMSELDCFTTSGTKYIENGKADLYGYRIDTITMTVDDLVITGSDRSFQGELDLTFSIFGTQIPEPASILLFAAAFIFKKQHSFDKRV